MRSVRTPTDRPALVCRIAATALTIAALTSTVLITTAGIVGAVPFNADPAAANTPASDAPSAARTPAAPNLVDRAFLHASTYEDKAYPTQMAAISLAHTECHYLDTAGNSDETHEYLAEKTRAWAQFPYLFLNSAIDAYCPQHRLN